MDFKVHPLRFELTALEPVRFPRHKAGNTLRGGFGIAFRSVACVPECTDVGSCPRRGGCAYSRVFQPRDLHCARPSGFADLPRPFVFRASHLDGRTIAPGESFDCDLHVFLYEDPEIALFTAVFEEFARQGFGPLRGKAQLRRVIPLGPVILPLHAQQPDPPSGELRICFLTPTELKSADNISDEPDFATVFSRARDRISSLSTLYGAGPLSMDFRAAGERSRTVRTVRADLRRVDAERFSTRTGQRHPLGGFTGEVDYAGKLGEFLPILRAAEWTGIGRQTVWGKGAIRCVLL